MGFDRSKFRGASRKALKAVQKTAEEKTVSYGEKKSGRAGFHSIVEGKNIRRICPPHKEGEPSYRPLTTSQLPVKVFIYKDGEKTEKTEIKNKKIFNAVQHSNVVTKDPVDTYLKHVYAYANEAFDDKTERRNYLKFIEGYREGKNWVWGIRPKTSFVCYSFDEDGKIGRDELWEKWVKEMDKIAARLEEEDDVISVDPFSSPDEGYPLVIDKSKNDKNKWEYTVYEEPLGKRETWTEYFEKHVITDEQLEELDKLDSLTDLYVNIYSKRDFDLAVEGLKRFDEKYEYNIFGEEDFLDELEEIEKMCPADEKQDSKDGKDIKEIFDKKDAEDKPEKVVTKKAVKKTPPKRKKKVATDNTAEIAELTEKLSKYIGDTYGEEWVYQTPKTIEELREWTKLMKADEDLPITEEEAPVEEVEETIEDTEIETSDEVSDDEMAATLAAIKAKRNKGK